MTEHFTGGFDAKGRRVKISAVAHSLAAASRGAQGPIGLFEADNNASMIIGANVRSVFQRKRHQEWKRASIVLATRIRTYPARKHFLELRRSVVFVQRYYRKNMLPRIRIKRLAERENRRAVILTAVEAFATAVDSHDLVAIKSMCTDDLSLVVNLVGSQLSQPRAEKREGREARRRRRRWGRGGGGGGG